MYEECLKENFMKHNSGSLLAATSIIHALELRHGKARRAMAIDKEVNKVTTGAGTFSDAPDGGAETGEKIVSGWRSMNREGEGEIRPNQQKT